MTNGIKTLKLEDKSERLSGDQMDELLEKLLDCIRDKDMESAQKVMLVAAYYVHTTTCSAQGLTDDTAKQRWTESYELSKLVIGEIVRTNH